MRITDLLMVIFVCILICLSRKVLFWGIIPLFLGHFNLFLCLIIFHKFHIILDIHRSLWAYKLSSLGKPIHAIWWRKNMFQVSVVKRLFQPWIYSPVNGGPVNMSVSSMAFFINNFQKGPWSVMSWFTECLSSHNSFPQCLQLFSHPSKVHQVSGTVELGLLKMFMYPL